MKKGDEPGGFGDPWLLSLEDGEEMVQFSIPHPQIQRFPFFICEMNEGNLGKGCDWASTHTLNIRHPHPSPPAQFTGAGPGWGERRGAETEPRAAPGVVRGAGRAQLPSTSMCPGLGNALCRLLSLKSHNQLLSWAAHRRVNRGLGRLSDLLRSPIVAELRFDPSNLWFFCIIFTAQPAAVRDTEEGILAHLGSEQGPSGQEWVAGGKTLVCTHFCCAKARLVVLKVWACGFLSLGGECLWPWSWRA